MNRFTRDIKQRAESGEKPYTGHHFIANCKIVDGETVYHNGDVVPRETAARFSNAVKESEPDWQYATVEDKNAYNRIRRESGKTKVSPTLLKTKDTE